MCVFNFLLCLFKNFFDLYYNAQIFKNLYRLKLIEIFNRGNPKVLILYAYYIPFPQQQCKRYVLHKEFFFFSLFLLKVYNSVAIPANVRYVQNTKYITIFCWFIYDTVFLVRYRASLLLYNLNIFTIFILYFLYII